MLLPEQIGPISPPNYLTIVPNPKACPPDLSKMNPDPWPSGVLISTTALSTSAMISAWVFEGVRVGVKLASGVLVGVGVGGIGVIVGV